MHARARRGRRVAAIAIEFDDLFPNLQGNGGDGFDAGSYSFFGNLNEADDGGLEGALEVSRWP